MSGFFPMVGQLLCILSRYLDSQVQHKDLPFCHSQESLTATEKKKITPLTCQHVMNMRVFQTNVARAHMGQTTGSGSRGEKKNILVTSEAGYSREVQFYIGLDRISRSTFASLKGRPESTADTGNYGPQEKETGGPGRQTQSCATH
ncbi:unnamed protein product [Caretta caretta]